MSKEELNNWMIKWDLKPAQATNILRISRSKMSEYLTGARKIPPYIAAHINTFEKLSIVQALRIIKDN